MTPLLLCCAALLALAPLAARAQVPTPAAIANAYSFSANQINSTLNGLPDTQYPQFTYNDGVHPTGTWFFTDSTAWTGGFWVGEMWQQFRQTGDPRWATLARSYEGTDPADPTHLASRAADTTTHDIGFVLLNSFGNALRYGSDADKALAKTVLTQGASSLDSRFNPIVGATRSHDDKSVVKAHKGQFVVIIDNMMNIELMFMGAELTTDATLRDQWYSHAVTHAKTTLTQHFGPDTNPTGTRPDDGSTYQAVYFDEHTGQVLARETLQGYSNSSCWSRGESWAVYGYAMCYRYAHRHGDNSNAALFLKQSEKAADYFVAHLPADNVPLWDFNAPSGDPRDTSAGAVAAAGLLELSTYMTDSTRQARYYGAAQRILAGLTSPTYLAQGVNGGPPTLASVLAHGTYNLPGKKKDQGLIWGDYYLLEALGRYGALLSPTADAYVRSGASANTNYGTQTTLSALKPATSGGDERWTYLKFDLKGLKGPVTNARLRLYGSNGASGYAGSAAVYGVASTSWGETTLTWNNKPAFGSTPITSAPVTSTRQYSDWNITQWVQAQRAAGKTSFSLAVKMSASGALADSFYAREAAKNGPQLAIQTY